jgi:hypothetical protein
MFMLEASLRTKTVQPKGRIFLPINSKFGFFFRGDMRWAKADGDMAMKG